MKISVICIGKTSHAYIKEGLEVYLKRIPHYINFEWLEIPDIKNVQKFSELQIKENEAQALLKMLPKYDLIILLDEKGKEYTSQEMAGFFQAQMNKSIKNCALIIGGAYGFAESIYKKAHHSIALSKLTFTHQMVRMILAEQIYRALTIIANEQYHH